MEDSELSKLFVGGISWGTTDNVLKSHFAKYGDVFGFVITRDRNSVHPRGFAFITFSDSSAVDRALQDSHQIHSRTVAVAHAIGHVAATVSMSKVAVYLSHLTELNFNMTGISPQLVVHNNKGDVYNSEEIFWMLKKVDCCTYVKKCGNLLRTWCIAMLVSCCFG